MTIEEDEKSNSKNREPQKKARCACALPPATELLVTWCMPVLMRRARLVAESWALMEGRSGKPPPSPRAPPRRRAAAEGRASHEMSSAAATRTGGRRGGVVRRRQGVGDVGGGRVGSEAM